MPLLPNAFRIGQTLWRVPLNSRKGPPEPAKVIKIGRKWIDVKIGQTGHSASRFDPATMLDDARVGAANVGRYWLSEAEYEASLKEGGANG
jgi:hypothetical protein